MGAVAIPITLASLSPMTVATDATIADLMTEVWAVATAVIAPDAIDEPTAAAAEVAVAVAVNAWI